MPMKRRAGGACAVLALLTALAGFCPAQAADNGKFRLGIVTFLSGPASGPFGVPAENAAKITIAALNNGKLAEPYATKGINGVEIETVVVDEAGGAGKQVEEFRNLVERHKVDAASRHLQRRLPSGRAGGRGTQGIDRLRLRDSVYSRTPLTSTYSAPGRSPPRISAPPATCSTPARLPRAWRNKPELRLGPDSERLQGGHAGASRRRG